MELNVKLYRSQDNELLQELRLAYKKFNLRQITKSVNEWLKPMTNDSVDDQTFKKYLDINTSIKLGEYSYLELQTCEIT